ncbi:MAG: hypothetical protein VB858_08415, partial [Planctomycetaceae bacterium]
MVLSSWLSSLRRSFKRRIQSHGPARPPAFRGSLRTSSRRGCAQQVEVFEWRTLLSGITFTVDTLADSVDAS